MTVADTAAPPAVAAFAERRRMADRIFRGALLFNAALTIFWLVIVLTGSNTFFFSGYGINRESVIRVFSAILFFYVIWGFIWYGDQERAAGVGRRFRKDERRQAFSSRMRELFDVAAFVARHSERRIRIVDMIGRRGRFVTLGLSGFFYLYSQVASERTPRRSPRCSSRSNLFDAVVTSWIFLAFYYANGFLAAAFYGAQSRVMDGVLARANCLLITTLWTVFKFVMVPIGGQLAIVFPPEQFAVVFALIWGSYMVTDTLAEVGGSLFGRQTHPRVGHRRRESQVDRRNAVGLRRIARLLPVGRPRARPDRTLDRPRRGDLGVEHAARAVLAARN